MPTIQVAQPAGVIEGLCELARAIGYEVVIQPGPMDAVVVIVWETATVSVNSRFPAARQAEELVYIMALLVERRELGAHGLHLTFCQQAQVVGAVAVGICSELGVASNRRTTLEIAGVWADVEPATVREVEDLVARVASCIATYVIPAW